MVRRNYTLADAAYELEEAALLAEEIEETFNLQLLSPWEADGVAHIVDAQYRAAISRRSDYACDLEAHILRGAGAVFRFKGSYLVGVKENGVFVVSHFAPRTLREGLEMMKNLADGLAPVTMAVPFFLARMAIRAGFEWVAVTHQRFGLLPRLKYVLVNRAMTDDTVADVQTVAVLSDVGSFRPRLP